MEEVEEVEEVEKVGLGWRRGWDSSRAGSGGSGFNG